MAIYHGTAAAGNNETYHSTTTPQAGNQPSSEVKPRYISTVTPYLIVECKYCKGVFRFENMNNDGLRQFRLSHSSTCAELQAAITAYKAKYGEAAFSRNRVKIIGSAIGGSRVCHKQKPEQLLTRCGPRCINAKGTACDCKCRGANHGRKYAA